MTYKNTGNSTVLNAQGLINVIDPFSSEDDIAYLGDKTGTVCYRVIQDQTEAGATIKTYSVDSEIGYTDPYRTEFTSGIPGNSRCPTGFRHLDHRVSSIIVIAGGGLFLWYRKKRVADVK